MRLPRLGPHHYGIMRKALELGGMFVPESRGQSVSMSALRKHGFFEKLENGAWALTRAGVFRVGQYQFSAPPTLRA